MYATKINLDDFFPCYGCKQGRHGDVNSKGYLEVDEPIRVHAQPYPLF